MSNGNTPQSNQDSDVPEGFEIHTLDMKRVLPGQVPNKDEMIALYKDYFDAVEAKEQNEEEKK